ncbi:MAG: hypothetical protein KBT30_02675, partial [Clostridiales bacterium]|nr:hypothetical protein [Candidatus Apopatousia equi]
KYNENDEVVIECKIGKAENIFNKYDLAKNRTMTDEFEKYLLEELDIIPLSENVALKLYVDENFTEENEKQVRKAIKRHFSFNITSDKIKMRNATILAIVLYALGAIFLTLLPFITIWTKDIIFFPFSEITLVSAWFCIWEAGGTAFFDKGDLREHRYNMLRLYNAPIEFVKVPTMVNDVQTQSQNLSSTVIANQFVADNVDKKIITSPFETKKIKAKRKRNLLRLFRKKNSD